MRPNSRRIAAGWGAGASEDGAELQACRVYLDSMEIPIEFVSFGNVP